MKLQGKRGAGAFQWNRGGWFGSQLGGTLWLVILGFVMLARSQPLGGLSVGGLIVAGLIVLAGVVPNIVGVVLWRRRDSLAPYPAIQGLLAACGLAALFAMFCIRASGLPLAAAGLPSAWFLLIYPALMLQFHMMERAQLKLAA